MEVPAEEGLPAGLSQAQLSTWLQRHEACARWFEQQRSAAAPASLLGLRVAYAAAVRGLGSERFTAVEAMAGAPCEPHWTCLDVGRLWLLLGYLQTRQRQERVTCVQVLYARGELGEQESLLRTLAWLPFAAEYLDTAIEACRHSATAVFAAIACDNPYPAALFPDLNFNQLVLKVLFSELPIMRVIGYRWRITPELQRMASDFAMERRAAGRAVPDDLSLILRVDVSNLDASVSTAAATATREKP
jgi:hypothetical protein